MSDSNPSSCSDLVSPLCKAALSLDKEGDSPGLVSVSEGLLLVPPAPVFIRCGSSSTIPAGGPGMGDGGEELLWGHMGHTRTQGQETACIGVRV